MKFESVTKGTKKAGYLLKDGQRCGELTYVSSAETASLILNQIFPIHNWSIEVVHIKPFPKPPKPKE